MKRLILLYSLVALLLGSCSSRQQATNYSQGTIDTMRFARGIAITHMEDYTKVEVRNPWDTTVIMKRYLLVDRDLEQLPENMEVGDVVRTPVKRVVVYSSVHASIIEMLGREDAIVGACEIQYLDSERLKERIASGIVADLGESTAPNIEKIMDIETEIIITSPFENTGYGAAEKLGIPIVEGADYMENHPLGRVEWIRLFGMLLGAENKADSIFTTTCSEYLELKKLTANVDFRPTVFTDTRYGGSWFVAGGDSYSAVLYADAGADYIFANDRGNGSLQMSFETVLDRAIHADIWLIKYYGPQEMSYSSLRADYEPYTNFDAFKNRSIYGCNTSRIQYYEDTPMHPQQLLRNYIYIFHPELLEDYAPEYFTPFLE